MKKFGHYEVTAELGRGGMGVVYKGWDPSLNRKVAIKALGEHLLNDKDLVERFTREAKATAALNDANVIQIYYIGEEQGQPYFAMEYIEGKSLDDILKGGKSLSIKHAKNILKQASSGLAAAHKLDLVHRDIKPANLMITAGGTLKIVDFGIARTREYGDKLTNTGEFVGTPGYLSPEVCIGQDVDLRSDIFSLGIVFYEMLAGKVPFENDSPLGLMLEVVQADIPDIRELNKKVDKKTSYILKKMIAKSPEERYQKCDEIIRDLGNTIENQDLYMISEGAQTVTVAVKKTNLSDQITIPGVAAITKNNMVIQSTDKPKNSKQWLIAAALLAVVGGAGFGFYNGYLPMPGNSDEPTTAFVDEKLMIAGNQTTEIEASQEPSESSLSEDSALIATTHSEVEPTNQAEESGFQIDTIASTEHKNEDGSLTNSGNNNSEEAPVIDLPITQQTATVESQAGEPGFQIDTIVSAEHKSEDDSMANSGNKNSQESQLSDLSTTQQIATVESQADSLQTTSETSMPAQKAIAEINKLAYVESTDIESLEKLAHVDVKTVQPKLNEVVTRAKSHKPVIKKTQPIDLNKGVVVLAFGDPAMANPVEKILESQLKQQGVKVMNEQFIPGMRQLLNSGLDLSALKKLIMKNGGQAMVIANINHVGTQELQYAGRSSTLVNAQLDIDAYDIKTGNSIGNGYGTNLNYTSLTATDEASEAVMQYSGELTQNLKNKI